MAAWSWLDERLGVGELLESQRHKAIPQHRHTWAYFGGGLIAVLFGIQVVSGLLLVLYYQPTIETAHESLAYLISEVPYGWAIRSVHRWTAHFVVVAVLVHLVSTMLLKAYRTPRELTWMTGCALLAVALGFGFTGYLLPWDEVSVAATKVGTGMPASLPLAGPWLVEVLRGGQDVTGATLTRFYGLHVCYLPLFLMVLAAVHFRMVQRLGMSLPPSVERSSVDAEALPFWPDFVCREAIVWLLVLGAILTLALLWPTGLEPKADLMAPAAEGIKPEWYFLFIYQTLKLFPAKVGLVAGESLAIGLAAVVATLLPLLPFLDRGGAQRRRVVAICSYFLLAYGVVMSIWGLLS
ncbi:cytochrome bc complex cytochrome b subunit [Candidatus Latescibacterota bacterium]